VPKNKIAEVWNLPHIQRKITASNNWFCPYINFSAYVGSSCNVFPRLLGINLHLKLEEPGLSLEEWQQGRRG
jgi:hypothetical protein